MEICEKHQLPLDRNGECELCRLSEMPSKVPPARSAWWASIIPIVLAVLGVAWAFSSFGFEPKVVPRRGVPTATRGPASPLPPQPPVRSHDVPVPKPSSEGARLENPPLRPTRATDTEIPEWKWNLARRRVTITMYATRWCGVCRKAREYMTSNRIDFTELDTDENPAAAERLGELNPRKSIPTFQIDELVYIGFREDLFETKLNQAARKHL